MPSGSCFCKKIKVEFTGDPLASALCHCVDCRKITGSLFTYSFVVPSTNFKVTDGSPKEIIKTSDSGNIVHNFFCSDCGSPLYGWSETPGGIDSRVVRAGIFDDLDLLRQCKPGVELYTPQRMEWTHPIEGATQFPGFIPRRAAE